MKQGAATKGGMSMGYKIREMREAKNMTQVELAAKSGVSRTTISNLENGIESVTTTRTLNKLATALGVNVEELFYSVCAQ